MVLSLPVCRGHTKGSEYVRSGVRISTESSVFTYALPRKSRESQKPNSEKMTRWRYYSDGVGYFLSALLRKSREEEKHYYFFWRDRGAAAVLTPGKELKAWSGRSEMIPCGHRRDVDISKNGLKRRKMYHTVPFTTLVQNMSNA